MGRALRTVAGGYGYHVLNRANLRMRIFAKAKAKDLRDLRADPLRRRALENAADGLLPDAQPLALGTLAAQARSLCFSMTTIGPSCGSRCDRRRIRRSCVGEQCIGRRADGRRIECARSSPEIRAEDDIRRQNAQRHRSCPPLPN
jgi:hypothetical protein